MGKVCLNANLFSFYLKFETQIKSIYSLFSEVHCGTVPQKNYLSNIFLLKLGNFKSIRKNMSLNLISCRIFSMLQAIIILQKPKTPLGIASIKFIFNHIFIYLLKMNLSEELKESFFYPETKIASNRNNLLNGSRFMGLIF